MIHTFETRLRVADEQVATLTAYCAEWSRGLRIAYAAVNRGEAQPLRRLPTATRLSGVRGVDLNAGGAAWGAVKPDGNRLVTADGAQTGFIEWALRGGLAAQRKAILSDAASWPTVPPAWAWPSPSKPWTLPAAAPA